MQGIHWVQLSDCRAALLQALQPGSAAVEARLDATFSSTMLPRGTFFFQGTYRYAFVCIALLPLWACSFRTVSAFPLRQGL